MTAQKGGKVDEGSLLGESRPSRIQSRLQLSDGLILRLTVDPFLTLRGDCFSFPLSFMKGSAMKLSAFWHYVKDVDMLWNSLLFSWCKTPSSVREIFKRKEYFHEKNLSPDVRVILIENGFLVHKNQEKELIEKLVSRKMTSEIKSLYLIMSTFCNLACTYCLYGPFQSGSLKIKGENLSEKEIRDAINIFRQKTLGNKRTEPDYWEQVTFYGGEPLFNPKGIKTGVEMIRKIQREQQIWQNIKIIIDTNGILIDDDFIDF